MVGRKKDNPPEPPSQPSGNPFDDDATAEAQMADQPFDSEMAEAVDEGPSEPMVTYVGEFGRREITTEDWRLAGVQEQPAAHWDRRNDFTLPQSAFTEHALRVLRQDGNFRFTQ